MSGQASRLLGRWGEERAAAYLRDKGYLLKAANWRCRFGELDLVAVTSVERSELLYKKQQFFAFMQTTGVKLALAAGFLMAAALVLRLTVFRKKRRPKAGAHSRGNYRGTRMR